jgi:hypothetical protein
VPSLAEMSLVWDPPDGALPPFPTQLVEDIASAARELSRVPEARRASQRPSERSPLAGTDGPARPDYERALRTYALRNAKPLHLDRRLPIEVAGFHSSFRVSPDGQLLIDIVAQFAQCDSDTSDELGGAPLRGGTTVVASSDGAVRYVIAKPLESGAATADRREQARLRRERQYGFVADCDGRDALRPWCADERDLRRRMLRMYNFASLHSRGDRS